MGNPIQEFFAGVKAAEKYQEMDKTKSHHWLEGFQSKNDWMKTVSRWRD